MNTSAQLTLEQLKEIIEKEKQTDKGAKEAQEQVDEVEEVLNPDNGSSVLNTCLNTINTQYEQEYLEQSVRLLNACLISQSKADRVPGNMYSIPVLPRTMFLAKLFLAIWFIGRRWVWDSDMPGALVADQMGLGKPLALVAVAMISQLLTEKIVMWLLQTIIWRNTLEEWVDMGQTYHPGIIGEDEEWIPLQRLNSAPRRRQIKIHTTPPDWHPVLTLTVEPILVVTMPGVADTFKSVIEEMTYGTNFKVLYLLHMENVNLTHEDLNSSIDEPEI